MLALLRDECGNGIKLVSIQSNAAKKRHITDHQNSQIACAAY
jgi:hypothetical protein